MTAKTALVTVLVWGITFACVGAVIGAAIGVLAPSITDPSSTTVTPLTSIRSKLASDWEQHKESHLAWPFPSRCLLYLRGVTFALQGRQRERMV